MEPIEVSRIKEHYLTFTNAIWETISDLDDNPSDDYDCETEYHNALEDMVSGVFPESLTEFTKEYTILGKGAIGLVITCNTYPNTAFKWYFDDLPWNISIEGHSYTHLGYEYKEVASMEGIILPPLDKLVEVYDIDAQGVLMERCSVTTVEELFTEEHPDFENYLINYTEFYIELLKEGFYTSDYTMPNMTFDSDVPKLIDLDYFKYSKGIKEMYNNYKSDPDKLYDALQSVHAIGSSNDYRDLILWVFKEYCSKDCKTHNLISTNPLD